jgi:hypothetical protein
VHGWPSFRDEEVVWDNVRCLRDGECVSLTGVHSSWRLPCWAARGRRLLSLILRVVGPRGSVFLASVPRCCLTRAALPESPLRSGDQK